MEHLHGEGAMSELQKPWEVNMTAERRWARIGGWDSSCEFLREQLQAVVDVLGEAISMPIINKSAGTNAETLEEFFNNEGEYRKGIMDVTTGQEGEVGIMKQIYDLLYTRVHAALRVYLISAGDSTRGPVGFCMRVRAASPEEALAVARAVLNECEEVPIGDPAVESLRVYFSPQNLTVEDIDDSETRDAVSPET